MLLTDWLRVLSASKGWNRAQRQARHRRRKNAGFMAAVDAVASQPESLEPRLLLFAPNDVTPGTIEFTTISGTTGFQFDGGASAENFGNSIRAAGDVNGDGFEDVIVGARARDSSAGAAYVLFGKLNGFNPAPDLNNLQASDGFLIIGTTNSSAGSAVSGGGDINGDGFDDVVVMASHYYDDTADASAYVVFGKSNNTTVNLSAIDAGPSDSLGFRFSGFVSTNFLIADSIATGGDINGDGYDDVVFGGPYSTVNGVPSVGAAYVVFGKSGGFNSNLTPASLNGSNGFVFTDAGTQSSSAFIGAAVNIKGDVNGDGYDDLLVGASRRSSNYGTTRYDGEAYVVFGRPSFSGNAEILASTLNGMTGFKATGLVNQQAFTGTSVSSGGDINGDGLDDLIIGAPGYDAEYGTIDGRAYVVFGKTNLGSSGTLTLTSLSNVNSVNGFRLDAGGTTDRVGSSVSITGDTNGDGFDDILVGAPKANYNGGHAYVIFGASSISVPTNLDALNGVNGFKLIGNPNEYAGDTVEFADLNGDGLDDILIGQPKSTKGRVTVIFGNGFGLHDGSGANGELGTGIQQFNGSTNGSLTATQTTVPDILVGGGGNDTLTSNGGADILIGGQGDDTLVAAFGNFSANFRFDGGTGVDVLTGDSSFIGNTIDLTALPGNRINDIEVINLEDSAIETLTLNLATVLSITGTGNTGASSSPYAINDPHTLTILRDADDIINGIDTANGWTQGANLPLNGKTFEVFTKAGATVRILSPNPEVGVTVSPATVNEDGVTNLVYTFSRTNTAAQTPALTVNYTVSGAASVGTDYTSTGSTVTFAVGASTATVTVDPTADGTVEPDEDVILTVTAGTGYNVAGSGFSATGTITNDDVPATGDVNGDGTFNNTDGILILLKQFSASNTTLQNRRGSGSTLSGQEIRDNIDAIINSGQMDVDETGSVSTTDGTLILLKQFSASNTTLQDRRGTGSTLTGQQIRDNIVALEPPAAMPAAPVQPADAPPATSDPPAAMLAPPVQPDAVEPSESESPEISSSLAVSPPPLTEATQSPQSASSADVDSLVGDSGSEAEITVSDEPFVTNQIDVTMELIG